MIKLIIGKSHYFVEYPSSQIPSCSGSYTGSHKSYQYAGCHPQKRESYHLTAGGKEIVDLDSVHIHSQIFIGGPDITDRRLLKDLSLIHI